MDVGSPLALALDNCGIVTVADLSTMTPEMIALLDYPNALLSDNIDKRAGPTQELELMPLKLGYKSILEWFPTWAYALYLANECMPLSAVAWHSMTAADFDFYRTSLGTAKPIIRAPSVQSTDCAAHATLADEELCTPMSTRAYRPDDPSIPTHRPVVDCCPSLATSTSPMLNDVPSVVETLEANLVTNATTHLAPLCRAQWHALNSRFATTPAPDRTCMADDDPCITTPHASDGISPVPDRIILADYEPRRPAPVKIDGAQHDCTALTAGDTRVSTYYAKSPKMGCVMMPHAENTSNPSAGCIRNAPRTLAPADDDPLIVTKLLAISYRTTTMTVSMPQVTRTTDASTPAPDSTRLADDDPHSLLACAILLDGDLCNPTLLADPLMVDCRPLAAITDKSALCHINILYALKVDDAPLAEDDTCIVTLRNPLDRAALLDGPLRQPSLLDRAALLRQPMSHADSCAVDCHFLGTDSRIVDDFASAENITAGHATFTTSHRISTLPMSDRTALSDDDPHVRITRTHTGEIPRISESDCAILADAELHVVMSEASDDPHIPDCATFTARKTPTFDCYKFAAADSSIFFVTLKAIDPCPRVTTLYADKDPRSTMSHAGDESHVPSWPPWVHTVLPDDEQYITSDRVMPSAGDASRRSKSAPDCTVLSDNDPHIMKIHAALIDGTPRSMVPHTPGKLRAPTSHTTRAVACWLCLGKLLTNEEPQHSAGQRSMSTSDCAVLADDDPCNLTPFAAVEPHVAMSPAGDDPRIPDRAALTDDDPYSTTLLTDEGPHVPKATTTRAVDWCVVAAPRSPTSRTRTADCHWQFVFATAAPSGTWPTSDPQPASGQRSQYAPDHTVLADHASHPPTRQPVADPPVPTSQRTTVTIAPKIFSACTDARTQSTMPHAATSLVVPVVFVAATMLFIGRAPNLESLADDDPIQDAVAPQPVLLALTTPARGHRTVFFYAMNDSRGPTNQVNDLLLRVPTSLWRHDTRHWICLCGHEPVMIATNVVILIREKIQVKIVHLIVHNVHLIVHNVDLHSRSPRNHVQSYVFWYEHDQHGFPPNFDHGLCLLMQTPTRAYGIAENGECSNWNTMDQPSLAGNSTHYPGTISTY